MMLLLSENTIGVSCSFAPDAIKGYPLSFFRIFSSILILFFACIAITSIAAQNPARIIADTSQSSLTTEETAAKNAGDLPVNGEYLSGMPMGGVGCGTVELFPDGKFGYAALNNNWNSPIRYLPGCFTGFRIKSDNKTWAATFTQSQIYGLPCSPSMQFQGLFPRAIMTLNNPELPVEISQHVYSSLLANDLKNSSLPGFVLVYHIRNVSMKPADVSFVVSWQNLSGQTGMSKLLPDSRLEPYIVRDGISGWHLKEPKAALSLDDRTGYNPVGNYTLLVQTTSSDMSVSRSSWNLSDGQPQWWKDFVQNGALGLDTDDKTDINATVAALAVKSTLRPKESRDIAFSIAWDTPRMYVKSGKEYGHFYQLNFDNASEIGRYLLENRQSNCALIDDWQNKLLESSLPRWLSAKLINDAHVLFTNTILTRDAGGGSAHPGEPFFTFLDGDENSSLTGNIEKRLFFDTLLLSFFPELDKEELEHIAAMQNTYGAIPQYDGSITAGFGRNASADSTSKDTRAIDSIAWVLQAAHYAAWTGDQAFLDTVYPAIKKAIGFVITCDRDSSGIPYSRSLFHRIGDNRLFSYTASLWLAALQETTKIAKLENDSDFATRCQTLYTKATDSFQSLFFGNGFYRETYAPGQQKDKSSDACFDGQLAGQSIEDLLDGDFIAPKDEINSAIQNMIARNDKPSLCGSFLLDQPDSTSDTLTCMPGISEMYQVPLYITHGAPSESLALLHKIYRWQIDKIRSPWALPESFLAVPGSTAQNTASHPDDSIMAAASWNTLFALAGMHLNLFSQEFGFTPHLPDDMHDLRIPIYAPAFHGWLEYRPGKDLSALRFRLDLMLPMTGYKGVGSGINLPISVLYLPDTGASDIQITLDHSQIPGKIIARQNGAILFQPEEPIEMKTGQRLEAVMKNTVASN
jgi:uncharacterized protein (DUF608 family)